MTIEMIDGDPDQSLRQEWYSLSRKVKKMEPSSERDALIKDLQCLQDEINHQEDMDAAYGDFGCDF